MGKTKKDRDRERRKEKDDIKYRKRKQEEREADEQVKRPSPGGSKHPPDWFGDFGDFWGTWPL